MTLDAAGTTRSRRQRARLRWFFYPEAGAAASRASPVFAPAAAASAAEATGEGGRPLCALRRTAGAAADG